MGFPLNPVWARRGWAVLLGAQLHLCPISVPGQDPSATPYWRSSFENGFPGEEGEWLNYDNGAWSEDGGNSSLTSTWTIVESSELAAGAVHGDHMYKGWINGEAGSESHRAYPVLHTDLPSPLVNSWWVYLDADYESFPQGGWHHFGTWGPNPDWDVHTMSVVGGGIEFAHVSGSEFLGSRVVPLREWFRITVYINYDSGGDNLVYAWLNGNPVLSAGTTQAGGQNLMRAHWGLYASANLSEGVQYNDDIQIWGLSGPWTDFTREPPSPYEDSSPILGKHLSSPEFTFRRNSDGSFRFVWITSSLKELFVLDLKGKVVARPVYNSHANRVAVFEWNPNEDVEKNYSSGVYLIAEGDGKKLATVCWLRGK